MTRATIERCKDIEFLRKLCLHQHKLLITNEIITRNEIEQCNDIEILRSLCLEQRAELVKIGIALLLTK